MTAIYRFRWNEPGVIDLRDSATIPPDPDGARWREYMEWMYAGGEAEPAIEPADQPRLLSKLILIQRMTEEEAVLVDAVRSASSKKESMLWEAAPPMIDIDDPVLRGFLITALGETRANELLVTE